MSLTLISEFSKSMCQKSLSHQRLLITWEGRRGLQLPDQCCDEFCIRFLIEIGKVNRIDRDPDNDVVISDPHYHTELSFDATQEAFILRDLGSSNGTKVSGQRFFWAFRLQDGDTVTFGMIEATLGKSPAKVQKLNPKLKRVKGDGQAPKRIPLKKAESSTLQDNISMRDKEIETSKQLVSAAVLTQYRRLRSEEGAVTAQGVCNLMLRLLPCDTRSYKGQS